MTDVQAQLDPLDPVPPGKTPFRLDVWLNMALGVLIVGVLVIGGFFAYRVYIDKQLENYTSAAGRVATALAGQIRKNPNDAVLRVRLGEAYATMGKYPEAIEQFNAALKIDPKHTGALLDLGLVAMASQHNSDAARYFQKVIDLTDNDQYQNINQTREAAYYQLGLIAMSNKQYEEAAGFFKAALRIRKDAADTYYRLAKALQGLGDDQSAVEQLQIGLQFDPKFAEGHYFLGQLYQAQNKPVEASNEFRLAVDLAPGADPPLQALNAMGTAPEWIAKAKQKQAAGDLGGAIDAAKIAHNIDPNDFEAAKLAGDLLFAQAKWADAIGAYEDALKLQPENAQVKAQIAAAKARQAAAKPAARARAVKKVVVKKAAVKTKTATPTAP